MANLLQTVRAKAPSTRAMLAIGGAAAVAVGVVQTTDTLAANTDAVVADASQIATQNYFPTPLPSSISCSESGLAGFKKANVSWPSAGPGMTYRVTLWNESLTSASKGPSYQTGTGWTLSVNYDLSWNNYVLTVQTVNTESGTTDANRIYSSGFRRITLGSNGQRNGTCQGGAGVSANQTWEDQTAFTPSAPAQRGVDSLSRTAKLASPSSSTTTSEPAPSSQTSETPPQPSSSTTPSEAPAPSDQPGAPSTGSPEPTTPPASAEADKITFGVGVAGKAKALLVYRNGIEICDFELHEGDTPSINGNIVSVTNGGSVKTVNPKTCTLS